MHYDMPADVYHADPVPAGSLSSSGAKLLLPPSTPAKFHHDHLTGSVSTRAMEKGTAAHTKLLGVGSGHVVIDAEDWRKKATQQAADEARAEGKVPLLRHEADHIDAMAAAVRRHPEAAALLDPNYGMPEVAVFWMDPETGVWRRAMIDFLRGPDPAGMVWIVDYKTAVSANPATFGKTIYELGYYRQAKWYLDAVLAHADDICPFYEPMYRWVVQEKTPPFLVSVVAPDAPMLEWGRVLNRKAIDVFRRCRDDDHWPGYSDAAVVASLPSWADYQLSAAYDRGEYNTLEDIGHAR